MHNKKILFVKKNAPIKLEVRKKVVYILQKLISESGNIESATRTRPGYKGKIYAKNIRKNQSIRGKPCNQFSEYGTTGIGFCYTKGF
jgi:hypothetical protein